METFQSSLFQWKNEPERSLRGWLRKAPFLILYWTSLAVVGAGGMWESRSDFQAGCETRRVLQLASFPLPFSTARLGASFFPQASTPQLCEEFAFGLLHTLGGFGIAERRGDAL